jgi:transposase-like protein
LNVSQRHLNPSGGHRPNLRNILYVIVVPEQQGIARLKREVAKLKAERGHPKKAAAYFAKEST